MSQPSFRFRHFEVCHDRCAMKVGTDGVLLGAWADLAGSTHILDVGTGTGLIALMAAQRAPMARIVGVEIDELAVGQARENVAFSPFANRVTIMRADIRDFPDSKASFDNILCNPPFFSEDTLPDNPSRALARHASHLRFDELIAAIRPLLTPSGKFHVILPMSEYKSFVSSCFLFGMFLVRQCAVRTVEGKPPKRTLLTFSPMGRVTMKPETLVLQNPDGTRSVDYWALTRDFYLW